MSWSGVPFFLSIASIGGGFVKDLPCVRVGCNENDMGSTVDLPSAKLEISHFCFSTECQPHPRIASPSCANLLDRTHGMPQCRYGPMQDADAGTWVWTASYDSRTPTPPCRTRYPCLSPPHACTSPFSCVLFPLHSAASITVH